MTVIPHAVTFANGKGGVGKTSLAAHVAGLGALSGWQVLAVDLDGQANLGADLGVERDDGESLKRAIVLDDPNELRLLEARPGFDIITGGGEAKKAWNAISDNARGGDTSAITALGRILTPIAEDYDLVIFDTPPAEGEGSIAVQSALACTGGVVLPVKIDDRSLDGLVLIAEAVATARTFNPHIEALGAVVFAVETAGKDIRRRILAKVLPLIEPGNIPFLGFVRHSTLTAMDTREMNRLAHEYEDFVLDEASKALPWYKRNQQPEAARTPHRSSAAGGVAGDYQVIAKQILEAVADRVGREHDLATQQHATQLDGHEVARTAESVGS